MRLRTKLLLWSSGLLLVPWLGYSYLQDMREFLLRGQESAQQLTAQAVATLLQNRPQLLAVSQTHSREAPLFAWPTDQYMQPDGYDDDWDSRIRPQHLGPVAGADGQPLAWQLRLAQRQQQLFLMVQVEDQQRIYQHPGFEALDRSDHLRLAFRYGGEARRLVIAAEGIGQAPVYAADRHWQQIAGEQPLAIKASWQERSGGYQVELQLPQQLLSQDPRLWLAVVDVDDPQQRTPSVTLASGSHVGRPVHLHAPELQQLVAGLRQTGRHIRVLDRNGVVRAVSNLRDATPDLMIRTGNSVQQALNGHGSLVRYLSQGQQRILATEPIRDANDQVMGVVMVEVATRDILELQRSTLLKTAALTLAVFAAVLVGLLWFGAELTGRIRRLARQMRDSLDERGRVKSPGLAATDPARDELAALNADVATLLSRLYHHGRYLERMPRTLRHELSNPLNTISTSLQMLKEGSLAAEDRRYLDSAERGVARLSLILETLSEAVSLEEALVDEQLQPVELVALMTRYLADRQCQYRDHRLQFDTTLTAAWTRGNELRLEQALDKLLDNAVDFALAGSVIGFSLNTVDGGWQLAVVNAGPPIPEAVVGSLFESLVSGRQGQTADGAPHLGVGLYVVRLIVAACGGEVTAANEAHGVRVTLQLPAARADS